MVDAEIVGIGARGRSVKLLADL